VATSGGDQAGGGEEAGPGQYRAQRGGIVAVVVLIAGGIASLEAAGFDVGQLAAKLVSARVGVSTCFPKLALGSFA